MKKIFFAVIVIVSLVNGFTNEHYNRLNGKTFDIGWYFWFTDGVAYLANGRDDSKGIAIWQLTEEKKWKPVHNTSAFDGYASANSIFNNITISNDGRYISFENQNSSYSGYDSRNCYNDYYSDMYNLDGYYTLSSIEFRYFNGSKDIYDSYQTKGSSLTIKNGYYYKKESLNGKTTTIWEGNIVSMSDSSLDIDWIDFPVETLEYELKRNKLTIIDKNYEDGVVYEYWIKSDNKRSLKTIDGTKRKFFQH